MTEYERGKNNAYATVERHDIRFAEGWLAGRMANDKRQPLSPDYIRGFNDQIAKEREYVV